MQRRPATSTTTSHSEVIRAGRLAALSGSLLFSGEESRMNTLVHTAQSHQRPVTRLLERGTNVSQHGEARWRMACPAHDSRHQSPTLAIRELPDGTLLLRCHAGCGAADIVAAVDLTLA